MLKLLLKKQLTEIFRVYFYDAKKNRARSKLGVIGFICMFVVIMVGILGGMFTFLSLSICGALSAAGVDWLYFSIMGLLAVLLGSFGSVFNTYSCLYLSKDNDLMLSLPIPVHAVITSRLLTVYLMGLMYSLVVILPAVIVYLATVSASVRVIFGSVLLMLLISLLVLTLFCVLGWVVSKMSLKLKHRSFVIVLISLLFIAGYYFVYFKAQVIIRNLLANAAVYGAKIIGSAYPLYLFGRVATGDAFAMAVVSAVVVSILVLIWLLIVRTFLKTATTSGRVGKNAYKEHSVKQKGIAAALLSKEFSRFTSNPTYMLNCGLGILLLPIFGLILLCKGGAVVSNLNDVFDGRMGFVPFLFSTAICMLSSMNNMTVPSISLEGKSLWLMQSLPVSPWQVLRAKLSMQLLLTGIPTLFCIGCTAFVYPYSIMELLFAVLVPMSCVLFFALFGLFLGLKAPNLNWVREISPIKQSAGVAFSVLGIFVYTVLLCAGFFLLDGWKLGFAGYMSIFGVITLVLCTLLWLWLRGEGCRRFVTL